MRKLALILLSVAGPALAAPVHLRTNALVNPLGIDMPKPTFSWMSDATTPNWMQSGYEVLVATDVKDLQPGVAAWDSGRVSSSDSVNVLYAGPPLNSRRRYVWKVLVWDKDGQQTTSQSAWFETGLLRPDDWKSSWIMRDDPAEDAEIKGIRWMWLHGADPEHVASETRAQFRYVLHVDQKPEAASLHVMVRGQYTAHVNGTVTGHHDLWGAFDREEITPLLHIGDNEIVLDVTSPHADGAGATAPAAVAASIRLTQADGHAERLVSAEHWQARTSPEGEWQKVQIAGPLSASFGNNIERQPRTGPDRITTDASLLRKEFSVASKIRTARLTITALGAYQGFLNGMAIAPKTILTPGWTDFHKRVQYQTYDVTPFLRPGANAIGVVLGGGWYSSPLTWAGYRDTPGPNLLRAQLDLTLADGTHQTIGTDASWLASSAPITFSEIYAGESYDARLEQRGWDKPGFDTAHWRPATLADPPSKDIELTAQPDLPITTAMTLHPVTLMPANSNHPVIYDMGQNMVGNVRLHVSGARGTLVRLRYAERLSPDGSLYTDNLRNADATDTYVLSGSGEETWTPAFTFHGFRYVEITFLGGTPLRQPDLSTIEGLVYNSLPATPSVQLTSSSDILNKMNELGAWGQRGNFVSIPTDCPQRDERLGWMGDAGAFWRTGTYNFDIDAFTHKFMLDVDDAQSPAGAFSDVSPNILGPNPGAPGWGDAGIFIPYAAWLQYGDTAVLARSWPSMQRWMDFILKTNRDFLRKNALGNNYGDWLAPDQNTPKDLIGTAYWALIAREMVEMAKALNRRDDAAKYQQQYDSIAAAYRTAYVKQDGSVSGDTQTAYLATLATAIAPQALRANMVARLVKDIEAHGDHLTTGFLGTPFLLSVLDENQQSDLAFKLLLSDTYPSWGYMVKKGATTWWERWNGDTGDPSMNSYNHYAFGSVMAWVYRRAAGIDTDATGAGFHHLVVHPHFNPSLPELHVEYDSVYGKIVSGWDASKHQFTITIPPNTTADVMLPGDKRETIGSGTHTYTVK